MELNQSSLRGILAQILSVDEAYIVPKQGNWWNPQENLTKPTDWCAYRIRANRPDTYPFHVEDTNVDKVCVGKIAEIELQFVGPNSEDVCQSVATWPIRSDVKKAFMTVQGAVLPDDMSAVASTFYQDGNNSVTAWNVVIRVRWISIMETTLKKLKSVIF